VRNCFTFPETGFVRLRSILGPEGPIPVSNPRGGRGLNPALSRAVKLGPRTTAWRSKTFVPSSIACQDWGAINESTKTQARGFLASCCVDVRTSLAQLRRTKLPLSQPARQQLSRIYSDFRNNPAVASEVGFAQMDSVFRL